MNLYVKRKLLISKSIFKAKKDTKYFNKKNNI